MSLLEVDIWKKTYEPFPNPQEFNVTVKIYKA